MTGAPRKSHCLRGHEIAVVGRFSNGDCKACRKLRNLDDCRRYRARKGATPNEALREDRRDRNRVPSEPLRTLAHNRAQAGMLWAKAFDTSDDAAYRRASDLFTFETLSIFVADRWSIAIGTHLANVYPELYGVSA